MSRLSDNRCSLKNRKFGRLTVIDASCREGKAQGMYWTCRCDCGNTVDVRKYDLLNGATKSCGCIRDEKIGRLNKTHGRSKTRLYGTWQGVKNRCFNPKDPHYKDYGGRGIIVCEEWLNDFQAFYDWSMANGYREGLTIDRIDVDGNYCPENCRWATMKEQSNNTRRTNKISYKGKTQSIKQWAEELGIKYSTLYRRIKDGWPIEAAFQKKIKEEKS